MAKKQRRSGPRGKYHEWLTEAGLIKLKGWAMDGLVDTQIAKNIGIAAGTLYEWKKKYPEIDESLKNGKEVVDRQVANALLKRALGYDYEETKQIIEKGANDTVRKRTERTTKHIPGDVGAQIIWLKNRVPKDWRDKPTTQDRQEQEARIDKMVAQTETIKGVKDNIEDTKYLRDLLFED